MAYLLRLIAYEVKYDTLRKVENATPGFGDALAASLDEDKYENRKYERVESTLKPYVSPNRLVFLVTIRNQMSRVFRGAGSVVQFNVNGKLQGVNQKNYEELTNAIIPPRNQIQLKIYGPLT